MEDKKTDSRSLSNESLQLILVNLKKKDSEKLLIDNITPNCNKKITVLKENLLSLKANLNKKASKNLEVEVDVKVKSKFYNKNSEQKIKYEQEQDNKQIMELDIPRSISSNNNYINNHSNSHVNINIPVNPSHINNNVINNLNPSLIKNKLILPTKDQNAKIITSGRKIKLNINEFTFKTNNEIGNVNRNGNKLVNIAKIYSPKRIKNSPSPTSLQKATQNYQSQQNLQNYPSSFIKIPLTHKNANGNTLRISPRNLGRESVDPSKMKPQLKLSSPTLKTKIELTYNNLQSVSEFKRNKSNNKKYISLRDPEYIPSIPIKKTNLFQIKTNNSNTLASIDEKNYKSRNTNSYNTLNNFRSQYNSSTIESLKALRSSDTNNLNNKTKSLYSNIKISNSNEYFSPSKTNNIKDIIIKNNNIKPNFHSYNNEKYKTNNEQNKLRGLGSLDSFQYANIEKSGQKINIVDNYEYGEDYYSTVKQKFHSIENTQRTSSLSPNDKINNNYSNSNKIKQNKQTINRLTQNSPSKLVFKKNIKNLKIDKVNSKDSLKDIFKNRYQASHTNIKNLYKAKNGLSNSKQSLDFKNDIGKNLFLKFI